MDDGFNRWGSGPDPIGLREVLTPVEPVPGPAKPGLCWDITATPYLGCLIDLLESVWAEAAAMTLPVQVADAVAQIGDGVPGGAAAVAGVAAGQDAEGTCGGRQHGLGVGQPGLVCLGKGNGELDYFGHRFLRSEASMAVPAELVDSQHGRICE